ncbi:hypothetical protein C2G38_2214612 [Gigaspora rosea]|uniref:Protein kinase domain-containing protein n=1 Tax=Gigaspora rosea TaxID=44941 RepID=A0A397UE91_9GLOM|nr:hypothetical protein C2G38_2214612 [Gigaspora rosea]
MLIFWRGYAEFPTFHPKFQKKNFKREYDSGCIVVVLANEYQNKGVTSQIRKCALCNEDNTSEAWCLSCDPSITTRWTIGNKDIDDCMKEFQLRFWSYKNAIEWIPFDKLSDIKEISKEKILIHLHGRPNCSYLNNIYADFHSGNILQDQQSHIIDLGLSKKKDDNASENETYSVMPYVPPKVLTETAAYTSSRYLWFGIIMAEMLNGQRPFNSYKFKIKSAVKICKGLRPEFASVTPKCYIELAEKYMNSDPQEHPDT